MSEEDRDKIVEAIGSIGKWQWFIILPLAVREVFTSWQMLSPPFLGMTPKNYFCKENGSEIFESLEVWQKFANPLKSDGSIDKCKVYDLDYSNLENYKDFTNASEMVNLTRNCQSWVFYENETSTLVTDFQLVCDRSWYMTTAQVVYMFGVMCGVLISGVVSD